MKKAIGILFLTLLLVFALGASAQAAEDTGKLIPFPGETWILTNQGSEAASFRMTNMDYVITDAEGNVTDRNMDSSRQVSIPAGGQLIARSVPQNSSSINAAVLPEGVTALRSETPRLLRADLGYGETCEFRNITDESANVLVESCCYFIYNSDGTVKEEVFNNSSSSVLSVPAGGRAVITTAQEAEASFKIETADTTKTRCMARAENFALTYGVPLDWTFGCVGINETMAFTNVSGKPQTLTCTGSYALYYAGGESAALKEAFPSAGDIQVPAGFSVALGCRLYDGSSLATYRFPAGAFEPVNLPGPVRYRQNTKEETTWTNISEYKAPVFGITKKMVETTFPEQIAVYAFGARQNVVEATDDGTGIYIPKGGRLVITKGWSDWRVMTLSGQFAVTGDKPVTEGDYVSLRAGQLLTVRHPDYSGVKISGEPYYGIYSSQPVGDRLTDVYESAGATFFQVPEDCTWSLSDGSMMETIPLSRGETWAFTARPGADSRVNGYKLNLRGRFLEMSIENDKASIGFRSTKAFIYLSPSYGRDRIVFTALEDNCRIQFNRLDMEAEKQSQSPFAVEVIPKGESRVFQFLPEDPSHASMSYSTSMDVFGRNPRNQEYMVPKGSWDERIYLASMSRLHFESAGIYGQNPLRVTSDDSDVVAVYLREAVQSSDLLLWPAGFRLLRGGEEVSDLGAAAIDTVELTLFTDRTEPLTLILAAYDGAGRQVAAVQRPVTAAELHEEGALNLSIPFSCGADAAKIKLMAVDNQYKPLIKAVTVAG